VGRKTSIGAFRVCKAAWHSENLIKTRILMLELCLRVLSPSKRSVARKLCMSVIILAVSVPLRAMSSPCFTVYLDSSFCNQANQTEQVCWVLILSSTSLAVTKSFTPNCLTPCTMNKPTAFPAIFLNQWPN